MNIRRERWQCKPLHGQYLRDIEGKIDKENTWCWLKIGDLKKETEGFIMAAQDQALRTNAIRAKIDKTTKDSKCRLCKEKEESVDHLASTCSKIAQTDYKERHNKVATMIHWNLAKNTIYLHLINGGNMKLKKSYKTKKLKSSGISKSRRTNIWLTIFQTSQWWKKHKCG